MIVPKMERSMLNITYRDRKTNISVREKTKVTDVIEQVRRGRPARHWRDELDDYWKGTIWQRIGQDRQMWKQHAEAFAQPWDIMTAQ